MLFLPKSPKSFNVKRKCVVHKNGEKCDVSASMKKFFPLIVDKVSYCRNFILESMKNIMSKKECIYQFFSRVHVCKVVDL